jgi:uncharacterized hydrophobic protein (TIGR00271 family)
MFLATAIAALGLLQDSTAVVVGAMLVAPLMTPIVGAGLSLVQGNMVLARHAVKAIISGFILALLVGMVIGVLTPGVSLNHELLGRGNPNTLDLAIAFFSGIAAAYALSRPNLSAALPGVAIAAALVQPVATIGIALVIGEFSVAQGAALLFGTNVVAIIIGSALVLHLVGIRAAPTSAPRIWASRTLLVLFLLFVVLAVPLSSVIIGRISLRHTQSVEQLVRVELESAENCFVQKVFIHETDERVAVGVMVMGSEPVTPAQRQALQKRINARYDKPVDLDVLQLQTALIQ